MALTISIETDVSNNEIAEFLRIDGLSIDEVSHMLSIPGGTRGKHIADLLKEKGLSIPLKIDMNTCQEFNLLPEKPIPEIQLIPVNREQVLLSLEKRCQGFLRVSETYATNQLPRLIKAATPRDRFVSLANFDGGIRRGENARGIWLLLIEIDSIEVFNAVKDFGPDLLMDLGKDHVSSATRALRRLVKGNPTLPFLVVYSGKKSFHCFWQLDRPISQLQMQEFCKAKDFLVSEIKRRPPEQLTEDDKALLLIDPQPLFRATPMGRIPCRVAEAERFPQIGWRTGSDGIIKVDQITEAMKPISERLAAMNQMTAIQRQVSNTGYLYNTTKKVTDADLRIAFPDAKSRGDKDGYSIHCPLHGDKNQSAFVSATGFIYCSVCCDANRRYVARVLPGGGIEKC